MQFPVSQAVRGPTCAPQARGVCLSFTWCQGGAAGGSPAAAAAAAPAAPALRSGRACRPVWGGGTVLGPGPGTPQPLFSLPVGRGHAPRDIGCQQTRLLCLPLWAAVRRCRVGGAACAERGLVVVTARCGQAGARLWDAWPGRCPPAPLAAAEAPAERRSPDACPAGPRGRGRHPLYPFPPRSPGLELYRVVTVLKENEAGKDDVLPRRSGPPLPVGPRAAPLAGYLRRGARCRRGGGAARPASPSLRGRGCNT